MYCGSARTLETGRLKALDSYTYVSAVYVVASRKNIPRLRAQDLCTYSRAIRCIRLVCTVCRSDQLAARRWMVIRVRIWGISMGPLAVLRAG